MIVNSLQSRFIHGFLTLLLLVLLTGCSQSFLYNRLDWLIGWYVDDYVDLDYAQKIRFRQDIQPLLQWHRQEELGNYIALLQRIHSDIDGTVTAEQIMNWIEQVRFAEKRLKQRLLYLALDFSDTLSDEQMAEFEANLWRRQSELEKKYLTRSDSVYAEESYERLHKYVSKFTGRLNTTQQAGLRSASEELQRLDNAWLTDRKLWLQKITPLLARPANWRQTIQTAFRQRERFRTAVFQSTVLHNVQVASQAIADVLNSLNNRQRQHIDRELNRWIRELRDLQAIERPAPTAIPSI